MKRMLTQQPVTEERSSITMLREGDVLQCSLPGLYARLQTTEEGLSSLEARRRLKVAGANETTGTAQVAGIVQFLRLFLSPLVIILLITSLVTAILGDILNASIIVLIVLLGLILNFMQTYRSQRAVERLRTGVAPLASVRRDGIWQKLPRRELVPAM